MAMHYMAIYVLKSFKHAWKKALLIVGNCFITIMKLKHIAQMHTHTQIHIECT
jgi:hypothetical protein